MYKPTLKSLVLAIFSPKQQNKNQDLNQCPPAKLIHQCPFICPQFLTQRHQVFKKLFAAFSWRGGKKVSGQQITSVHTDLWYISTMLNPTTSLWLKTGFIQQLPVTCCWHWSEIIYSLVSVITQYTFVSFL